MNECEMCGAKVDGKKRFCIDCIRERDRRMRQQAFTKAKIKSPAKIHKEQTDSLNAILKRIEKYNEKHGTHLSYGQYVDLKRRGLLQK